MRECRIWQSAAQSGARGVGWQAGGMSFQLSIFDEPAPPMARSDDPATSHAAAASAKELQARHHRIILGALEQHGPLGKDGLAARTSLTGVAVCRRLTELQRLGLIQPTGRNVTSTAGRAEREWRIRA